MPVSYLSIKQFLNLFTYVRYKIRKVVHLPPPFSWARGSLPKSNQLKAESSSTYPSVQKIKNPSTRIHLLFLSPQDNHQLRRLRWGIMEDNSFPVNLKFWKISFLCLINVIRLKIKRNGEMQECSRGRSYIIKQKKGGGTKECQRQIYVVSVSMVMPLLQ